VNVKGVISRDGQSIYAVGCTEEVKPSQVVWHQKGKQQQACCDRYHKDSSGRDHLSPDSGDSIRAVGAQFHPEYSGSRGIKIDE
jgi:hypothetical protein